MFKPKFNYTNRIVNNLLKILNIKNFIESANILPKSEVMLRRDARIKGTHASTSIEGNPLTLEDVVKLARGEDVYTETKSKLEVINHLKVLKYIGRNYNKIPINKTTILKIHKDIVRNTLYESKNEGRYRDVQVFVGDSITREVMYMPPSEKEVPKLMRELIEWINKKIKEKDIDPILIAGITHYQFVHIHPFVDGNGRTARVLCTLVLYKTGYEFRRLFNISEYYEQNRRKYYDAIQSVRKNDMNMTEWLEYFTDGLKFSMNQVKERVLKLSISTRRGEIKEKIYLTNRQQEIIEFLNKNEKITTGVISNMFKITRQAALKEISKLVKLDIVKLKGKGRGACYILSK